MPGLVVVEKSKLILTDSSYSPGGYSQRVCWAASPGGRGLGLYKEYREDKRPEINSDSLEALISWRQYLSTGIRKFVDSFCAFPHTVVRDADGIAGVIMNEAPAAFLQLRHEGDTEPRQAEYLGRGRSNAQASGFPYFEVPHKLALLGVLLQRLIWLHDQRVVVSDLHPRNMLVTADLDDREIYFLDCDSFWIGGRHAFPPHAPEMWQVGEDASTPATDLAKFSRLVSRTVCDDFSINEFPAEQLKHVLPGHHVRALQRLWAVDPSLPAEKLRSMAHTWTSFVRSTPGRTNALYIWPDGESRIPWRRQVLAAEPSPSIRIPWRRQVQAAEPSPSVPMVAIAPLENGALSSRGHGSQARKISGNWVGRAILVAAAVMAAAAFAVIVLTIWRVL